MSQTDEDMTRSNEAHFQWAKTLATGVLDALTLQELMEVSSYTWKIRKDYYAQEQDRANRMETEDFVPYPSYRKVPFGEGELPAWEPKIQGLFTQDDGTVMDGVVFVEVSSYLSQKARDNPLF